MRVRRSTRYMTPLQIAQFLVDREAWKKGKPKWLSMKHVTELPNAGYGELYRQMRRLRASESAAIRHITQRRRELGYKNEPVLTIEYL